MDEDRVYVPQQSYHWVEAVEEIRSDLFQDNFYDMHMNHYMNYCRPNYQTCDTNNSATSQQYSYTRGVNAYIQQDVKPNLAPYKNHQAFSRTQDPISGKSPLLKKMLQAPMGVCLEEIARPDPYLSNYDSTLFTMPNELLNDYNSDTLTAESEGNDFDNWGGYRYNGLVPQNYYLPKSGMEMGDLLPYQTGPAINVQENCRNWLISSVTPPSNAMGKNDLSPYYEKRQGNCQPNVDVFLTNTQEMESQEPVFTDIDGNPCSSYYAQDIVDQNFNFCGQNMEENNFVLPDQQMSNFMDYSNQYNYAINYEANENGVATYTVLDDNKGLQSTFVAESELSSSNQAQVQNEIPERISDDTDTLQPFWPSLKSNSSQSKNLENLLNLQCKPVTYQANDSLCRVIYCCKAPIMVDKIKSKSDLEYHSSGLPIEDWQHVFTANELLFQPVPESIGSEVKLLLEDETSKDVMLNDDNMDLTLEQCGEYNYYLVEDYHECSVEDEDGDMTTAILMPITDAD